MQTRVIGLRYGEWGRHEFGTKPVKVDMLQWQIMRLDELRRQIQEEAAPKQRQISSTAFVTFKCALGQCPLCLCCWVAARAAGRPSLAALLQGLLLRLCALGRTSGA